MQEPRDSKVHLLLSSGTWTLVCAVPDFKPPSTILPPTISWWLSPSLPRFLSCSFQGHSYRSLFRITIAVCLDLLLSLMCVSVLRHYHLCACIHLICPLNFKILENGGVFDLSLISSKASFQNIYAQIKKHYSFISINRSFPTRQWYAMFWIPSLGYTLSVLGCGKRGSGRTPWSKAWLACTNSVTDYHTG